MKYNVKKDRQTVDAIQWTGKNTIEVCDFVEGYDFVGAIEKRPDGKMVIAYTNKDLSFDIQRSEFVVFDEDRNIRILSENDFLALYEGQDDYPVD